MSFCKMLNVLWLSALLLVGCEGANLRSARNLKDAVDPHGGRILTAEYDGIVSYVNSTMLETCEETITASAQLGGEPNVKVICILPDKEVVLDGSGSDPSVNTITLCKIAQEKLCTMTDLRADKTNGLDPLSIVKVILPPATSSLGVLSASTPASSPSSLFPILFAHLNDQYGEACVTEATPEYTTVTCTNMGDAAEMVGAGSPPVAQNVTICSIGELASQICQTAVLAGVADPLQVLDDALKGTMVAPKTPKTFDELVTYLNSVYKDSCTTSETGSGAGKVTTVACSSDFGTADLVAEGDPPMPTNLTECLTGLMGKDSCQVTNMAETGSSKTVKSVVADPPGMPANGSAYDLLSAFMNITFEGNCEETKTTGIGSLEPTSTFVCAVRGLETVLVGSGEPDPVVQSVSNCRLGSMLKKQCESMSLADASDPYETGKKFVSRPHCHTGDFALLVEYLNTTFTGTCVQNATVAQDQDETTTVTVACNNMGGEVYAIGVDVQDDPYPQSLTVCQVGSMMARTCNSHSLEDCDIDPVALAKEIFGGVPKPLSVGHYDQLVTYLNQTFDFNCDVEVTRGIDTPITTVGCMKDGGEAILVAEGAPIVNEDRPEPRSLTICMFQDFMKKQCQTASFAKGTENPVDIAKFMLEGIPIPANSSIGNDLIIPTAAPSSSVFPATVMETSAPSAAPSSSVFPATVIETSAPSAAPSVVYVLSTPTNTPASSTSASVMPAKTFPPTLSPFVAVTTAPPTPAPIGCTQEQVSAFTGLATHVESVFDVCKMEETADEIKYLCERGNGSGSAILIGTADKCPTSLAVCQNGACSMVDLTNQTGDFIEIARQQGA